MFTPLAISMERPNSTGWLGTGHNGTHDNLIRESGSAGMNARSVVMPLAWVALGIAMAAVVGAGLQTDRAVGDIALAATILIAAAIWAATMLALLRWLLTRPTRTDVARVMLLQRGQQTFNATIWQQQDVVAQLLRLLVAREELAPVEADLATLGAALATFEAPAEHIAAWDAARARWYAIAGAVVSTLPEIPPTPDAARVAAARAALPFGRNLASRDLKAALHHLATAAQLAEDRSEWDRERKAMIRRLPDPLPASPESDAAA